MIEFEKYKLIPEYALINYQMSLSEFKVIYLWEWGHRFLARIVGLIALLPFIYLLFSFYLRCILRTNQMVIFYHPQLVL